MSSNVEHRPTFNLKFNIAMGFRLECNTIIAMRNLLRLPDYKDKFILQKSLNKNDTINFTILLICI